MNVNIGDFFKLGENGTSINGAVGYGSIGEFLTKSIIPNILLAANLILFGMILLSGFTIVTNAGNADKQKQGKETLTWAFVGFLIVFGAYWIMQILGIISGTNILSNESMCNSCIQSCVTRGGNPNDCRIGSCRNVCN